MSISRISSPRAAGFFALALALFGVAAAPGDASAQRDRRATYLSDREAPRGDCRPSPRPGRLPTLDVLADSAALMAGIEALATEHNVTHDTSFVLLSVWLAEEGTVERVQEIEHSAAAAMLEPLKALVSRTLEPQRGGGYLRLRIHPGTRRVLVGHSEVCLPRGPDRARVRRHEMLSRRETYQTFRARIVVNADGRALGVTPSRSTGDENVNVFIVRMLQSASYTPGLVDGIATQMQYEQDVRVSQ
jgi:hypothetical protein